MAALGIILVVCALLAFAVALGLVGGANRMVRKRLQGDIADQKPEPSSGARTTLLANSELGWVRYLVPPSLVAKAERNLVLAGRPSGWTMRRILAGKVILTVFAGLLAFMTYTASPSPATALIGLVAVVIGYVVPDVLLHGRAVARQQQIEHELPDILDQTNISIEAGLGFEGALARVGSNGGGPLAEELVRTVQDMRLGMSRRDAYQALADRTTVDDLRRFTRSIVQAEEFGVSVSNVVRTQAAEMRMKRRYRAEAKALQVPVKMLFPLLVCLLPVLFIVVLAPAAMNIADTFSKG